MENTLENKAKFFSQYWGQTFIYTGSGRPMRNLPKRFVLNYETADKLQLLLFSNNRSVELKSLSDITDEDAIESSKIYDAGQKLDNELHCLRGKRIIKGNAQYNSYLTDYLRSKGYALPWLGLSVEKQIEYGWVKIKNTKDE